MPRPKVERLRLARGLMQTFVFPQGFPLVTEGKNEEEEGHRLNLNLNFHLNAMAQRVDIYSSTTVLKKKLRFLDGAEDGVTQTYD